MSLLAALNLRPTPALRARIAASAPAASKAPPQPTNGTAPKAAANGASKPAPSGARDDAAKLKVELEHRHREAYAEWQRLEGLGRKLDALIKATKHAAQKAELAGKRKILAGRIERAEQETTELHEHIEKLEDGETSVAEVHRILATHGSTRTIDRQEAIDLHPLESRKPGEKHETRTTTAMIDGTSFVDSTETKRTWGVGGGSQTDTRTTEISRGGHTTRTEQERTVGVSLAGKKVSIENRRKVEVERPGGLVNSREQSSGTEIGAEGASHTRTTTVTNSDGSSRSTSKTAGVERGDGKVGVAASGTKTTVDASGHETTGTLGGKGGLSAKDGVGGYAEGTGSVGTQRKGGFNTKASLGLKSNVTCDIEGPDEKGLYTVKLDVVLGAALDVKAGRERKGGSTKASIGAQASETVTMHREVPVHARDIQGYVDDLKKANAGQKVSDATRVELQIIATGVSESWAAAKRLFDGKALDVGAAEGSSTTLGSESSRGGSVGASVKGVGVSGTHTETHGHQTKATRNAKGGLDVESTTSDVSKTGRGASLDTGTTSFGVSAARTLQTSVGYVITIPAGADPDGKLLAAFHACKTPAEQERFIAAHRDRIQLVATKRGTQVGSEEHDTFGALGADLDLATTAKVSKQVTTDASGKPVKSQVVGESSIGGSAGIGETLRVGDTTKDTATSAHDDKGAVDLDLARDKSSTSLFGKVKGMLFGDEEEPEMIEPATADGVQRAKEKRAKGAIAKAAGGEAASGEEHHVYGVKLGKGDIAKIVALAGGDAQAWSQCAWGFDRDAIREWSALRGSIAGKGAADPAFVADSLAEYVGRDRGQRMEALLRLVRPMGNVSIGARNEFPKSVKGYQKVYAELVLKPCEQDIAETAEAEGAERARKLAGQWMLQLGRMAIDIQKAEDFSSAAARQEMVAAINDRKEAISAAVLKVAGGGDAAQQATARRHDYERVRDHLREYPKAVAPHLAHLADELGGRDRFIGATRMLATIEELANLYALWNRDYAKGVDLARKAGVAESELLPFKPDMAAYRKYRRAAGLSDA